MSKTIFGVAVLLFLCVGTVVTAQFMNNGAYHCGRCGIQKWKFNVLWMDFGEPPQDEYGVESRWLCSHGAECNHVWLEGPLGKSANAYWPALHLMIAKGEAADKVEAEMDAVSDAELQQKDALGRSIMHWLVLYPHELDKTRLIEIAKSRGMDMDGEDQAGLSPLDWRLRCLGKKEED